MTPKDVIMKRVQVEKVIKEPSKKDAAA
jgi:hypothetical protein